MDKIKIADILLKIKAVELNTQEHFTWASGIKSPIYCDNRKILSFPDERNIIRQEFTEYIKKYYPEVEIIAGVATGGIAHGILVADTLNLPFVYVRSKSKQHGLQNQIEGVLTKNQKVVVIEDLISTGGSSLQAVEALREANANVLGLIAIFSYNLPVSIANFSKKNCSFHTLTDFDTLINRSIETNYIKKEDLIVLENWKKNFQNT